MSVTNLFIARHGETEYNRKNLIQGRGIDELLNETGRLQANAIAEFLSDNPADHIFTSSMRRAMETAEIIAWSHRKEYAYFEDLDEMNFGVLEGKPIEEVKDDLRQLHETWKGGNIEFAPENGESPLQVFNRASARMKTLLKEHQGTNILFILHGRLIRILLSDWLGYGLQNMHKIEHSNGALYHLHWKEHTFNPVFLHKTDHLQRIANSR